MENNNATQLERPLGRSEPTAEISREGITEISVAAAALTGFLRLTHETCEEHNDVATVSLIENWVDEGERCSWFMAEINQRSSINSSV
jgi:DNA-binding ferritin-like protein